MNSKQIEKLNYIERSQFFRGLVEEHLDAFASTTLTLDSYGTWNCLIVETTTLDLSVTKLDEFCELLKSYELDVDVMFKVVKGDARTLYIQFNIIS